MITKVLNNPLLERALDGAWLKNEAIADNIANVDTPGYKRKDVKFEDELKAAMKRSAGVETSANPKHIPINSASVKDVKFKETKDFSSTSMRVDGNNVDIDIEMAEMAKNQILYNTYSTLMNGHFSKLRSAIREGR